MKRKLKIILIISSIIFTVVITFSFLASNSNETLNTQELISPSINDIVKKTVVTGSICPRKEVLLKPQVSGIVEKLFVTSGMQVKQGDLIAQVKIIPSIQNLANAENRVKAAEINFETAQQEFDRQKSLFDKQIIPKSELITFENKFKSAGLELNTAKEQLQIVQKGISSALNAASNTFIKATISGMITDVMVKEGSHVIESNTFNDGTSIASIANMDDMVFEGKIDESEVAVLKENMNLIITIGAINKLKFLAKLEYVAPKGSNENGAIYFFLRAKIENKNGQFIRAGYSANADIILEKKKQVLAINERVLQFEKDKTDKAFVEVETKPNTFEKRFITTGLSDGINIEVVKNLTLKDKVKVPKINLNIEEKTF